MHTPLTTRRRRHHHHHQYHSTDDHKPPKFDEHSSGGWRNDNAAPSHELIVRNLVNEITEEHLLQAIHAQFTDINAPISVRIPRDFTGWTKGYAFIEFDCVESATALLERSQHTLKVQRPRKDKRDDQAASTDDKGGEFMELSMDFAVAKRRSPHRHDDKQDGHDEQSSFSIGEQRRNDWVCDKCNERNFSFRQRCFSCREPKSELNIGDVENHDDATLIAQWQSTYDQHYQQQQQQQRTPGAYDPHYQIHRHHRTAEEESQMMQMLKNSGFTAHDSSTGYYYNQSLNMFFDPQSCYYYDNTNHAWLCYDAAQQTYVPVASSSVPASSSTSSTVAATASTTTAALTIAPVVKTDQVAQQDTQQHATSGSASQTVELQLQQLPTENHEVEMLPSIVSNAAVPAANHHAVTPAATHATGPSTSSLGSVLIGKSRALKNISKWNQKNQELRLSVEEEKRQQAPERPQRQRQQRQVAASTTETIVLPNAVAQTVISAGFVPNPTFKRTVKAIAEFDAGKERSITGQQQKPRLAPPETMQSHYGPSASGSASEDRSAGRKRRREDGSKSTLSPLEDVDNVGNRMLKRMGWTGGGLGRNEHGITDAIQADQKRGRVGLGFGPSSSNTPFK